MDIANDLRDLTVHINAIMRLISSNYGLTLSQTNILSSLPSNGISLISLSKKIGVDISTMSRNIKKLSNKNLIFKERNSNDLREYKILITKSAEDILMQINNDFNELLYKIPDFTLDSSMNNLIENMNWLLLKSRSNL